MHFKSEISSCCLISSNRVFPISKKAKADKRVRATKGQLREKNNHLSIVRRHISVNVFLFSRSTKSDPFIQSLTNRVQANNIRICSIVPYVTRPIFQQWSKHALKTPTSYSIFQEVVYRPPMVICWFKRAAVNLINFQTAVRQD